MLRPAVFTPFGVICRGLPDPDQPCLARNSVFDILAGVSYSGFLLTKLVSPMPYQVPSIVPVLASYSGVHVKLNEFCTKPVLTSLEGLSVLKVLLVLGVCLFKMKLTISEGVQAQGRPVKLLSDTTSAN